MLAYYQDYINSAFVPNGIRQLGSSTPSNLIWKMIELTPSLTATLPTHVSTGVYKFLNQYSSIDLQVVSNLPIWDLVVEAYRPSRPICVGLLKMNGSTYGDHWVTVFQAHDKLMEMVYCS